VSTGIQAFVDLRTHGVRWTALSRQEASIAAASLASKPVTTVVGHRNELVTTIGVVIASSR